MLNKNNKWMVITTIDVLINDDTSPKRNKEIYYRCVTH